MNGDIAINRRGLKIVRGMVFGQKHMILGKKFVVQAL
jgi:hypothetical protein